MHGDDEFKKAASLAYPEYDYDMYYELMLNPLGVKANCEWSDNLTLVAQSQSGKSISGCTA